MTGTTAGVEATRAALELTVGMLLSRARRYGILALSVLITLAAGVFVCIRGYWPGLACALSLCIALVSGWVYIDGRASRRWKMALWRRHIAGELDLRTFQIAADAHPVLKSPGCARMRSRLALPGHSQDELSAADRSARQLEILYLSVGLLIALSLTLLSLGLSHESGNLLTLALAAAVCAAAVWFAIRRRTLPFT